jgi:hypothetical protein
MASPLTVRVDFNATLAALRGLGKKIEQAVADGTTAGANIARNHATKQMRTVHGGKTYRSRGSKRKHKASAPGEHPAVDLGDLVRSLGVVAAIPAPTATAYFIQNDSIAPHGKWLEYGTKNLAPRPFMERSVIEKQAEIVAIIRKAVSRALDDGNGQPVTK